VRARLRTRNAIACVRERAGGRRELGRSVQLFGDEEEDEEEEDEEEEEEEEEAAEAAAAAEE